MKENAVRVYEDMIKKENESFREATYAATQAALQPLTSTPTSSAKKKEKPTLVFEKRNQLLQKRVDMLTKEVIKYQKFLKDLIDSYDLPEHLLEEIRRITLDSSCEFSEFMSEVTHNTNVFDEDDLEEIERIDESDGDEVSSSDEPDSREHDFDDFDLE